MSGVQGPLVQSGSSIEVSQAIQSLRAISVGALGDSLIGNGMINTMDLTNGGAAPTISQINNSYATGQKYLTNNNILLHASLRGGNAWFPFQWQAAYTNATTQMVLDYLVPVFLSNPYGLPDACVVLAGSNDTALGGGSSFNKTTTLANLRSIYQALINAGITPIACTIPPRLAQAKNVRQLNMGIMQLARSLNIPLADLYSTLVNPADGLWAQTYYTTDNIHFASRGAVVAGYTLNNAILDWFRPQPRTLTASYDNSTITEQTRNPNFLTFTGSVNTAGSYPTTGWNAPGTPAMSTVFNSSGTEPGVGLTMARATPALGGTLGTPNYQGNSWGFTGNGTNTILLNGPTNLAASISAATGHRIAISFRIKVVPNYGAANPLDFIVGLQNVGNGHIVAGILGQAGPFPIGSEADYNAGDFYMEYTCVAAEAVASINPILAFRNNAVGPASVTDSLVIANFQMYNLTAAGLV